jgi:hypothetical protein
MPLAFVKKQLRQLLQKSTSCAMVTMTGVPRILATLAGSSTGLSFASASSQRLNTKEAGYEFMLVRSRAAMS